MCRETSAVLFTKDEVLAHVRNCRDIDVKCKECDESFRLRNLNRKHTPMICMRFMKPKLRRLKMELADLNDYIKRLEENN